jgi:hypothetical protein
MSVSNSLPSPNLIYALGISLTLVMPSPSQAQTKTAGQSAKSAGQSQNATQGNQANAHDTIATLHIAKQLLEGANHDYNGHRARAMHEIHEAIQELGHHNQNQSSQAGNGGQGSGQTLGMKHSTSSGGHSAHAGGHSSLRQGHSNQNSQGTGSQLSQAESDAQLGAAHQLLVAVQGQMAGKHAGAAAHVQVAVQEVQAALQVK